MRGSTGSKATPAESVALVASKLTVKDVPPERMSSGVKVKTWEETSVGSSPAIVPVTIGAMERRAWMVASLTGRENVITKADVGATMPSATTVAMILPEVRAPVANAAVKGEPSCMPD